jgi:hypothetical protein
LLPFIVASAVAFLACLGFRQLVVMDGTLLNIAASGAIVLVTTLVSLLFFKVGRSALLDVKYLLFLLRPDKRPRSIDVGTGAL